ncbi:MAG: hypothetical protein AUG00_10615 [Candidatus Rokubacteria bacterium 13_1_20CM_2_70_7]|nr:MAG: hypothetical protein AUG00_10615 [Candidatus Rokubacteria bacterium 13_1_20CM_2_70_7]
MSIAGGLYRALERGREVGCCTVQIFLKNQRQWSAPRLRDEDVRAFAAARRQTGIRPVFAHGSYLINLAAPDQAQWAQAVDAFADELERGEALGLSCVVIHPGSHLGAGAETGLRRVTAALDEVTRRTTGYRIRIALENTAGGGYTLGRTFAELGALLAGCHLFAAGYDIGRHRGYQAAITECARTVGLSRILAFHLNDAGAPRGSGLDRHQHIGEGFLGPGAFRRLLKDRRFARIPKVLETPKEPEPQADRRNLARLRALRASATSSRPPVGRAAARGRASSGAR